MLEKDQCYGWQVEETEDGDWLVSRKALTKYEPYLKTSTKSDILNSLEKHMDISRFSEHDMQKAWETCLNLAHTQKSLHGDIGDAQVTMTIPLILLNNIKDCLSMIYLAGREVNNE